MACKAFLRTPFTFSPSFHRFPSTPPKPNPPSHLLSLPTHSNSTPSSPCPPQDTVEDILSAPCRVRSLMKMQRRSELPSPSGRWFPYLDSYHADNDVVLTSREVLEALDGYILDARKERLRTVVSGRSYALSLVVEGLTDYGNVSAAFRSADALGVQSVHVISKIDRKRYRDNRHVSRGAEKWLDIELWSSPEECFRVLKSRGYRIATTHLGGGSVSIYDMDWTSPIALVVGNEHMGTSDKALELSDLHCHIPMNGMVDSFNVSVASGILLHYAVSRRLQCLRSHGDLTPEESQILLAEFYLRHREGSVGVVEEYIKRKEEKIVV